MPEKAPEAVHAPTHAKPNTANMRPHSAKMRPHCGAFPGAVCLSAANEATESAELAAANAARAAAAEFVVTQGETLEVPFGEYPHDDPRVGVQVLDLEAANAIVASMQSLRGRLAARWGGYPVYVGHPDDPGFEDGDGSAYGWIMGAHINAANTALVFEVKWTPEGSELVSNARYKYYSPRWGLTIRDASASNRRTAPCELKSVGLTNRPNIPVPPVSNTKPAVAEVGTANQEEDMDPKQLAIALGLAEDATPEQITEALAALKQERDDLATQLTEAQAANAEADQAKSEAEAKADAEKTNAANARKSYANELITNAIAAGKVPETDRDTLAGEFEANFAAANAKLTALRPQMPIDSKTGTAHTRKPNGDEGVQQKIVTACNEAKAGIRAASPALNAAQVHTQAYAQVKKEHPDWFKPQA